MPSSRLVGLIAGAGDLPLIFARRARVEGIRLATVGLKGLTSPKLVPLSEQFTWISLGQLGSLLSFFNKNKVSQTVIHGKVQLSSIFRSVRLDLKALSLWIRMKDRSGESILKNLADELARNGTKVLDGRYLMTDYLAIKGCLTKTSPDKKTIVDITLGLSKARSLARAGIGQVLAIKQGTVVAVEAVEGTDETIHRAGHWSGPGIILIKTASPKQDWRFDVPTIGLKTIEGLAKAKAKGLVLESGKSFLLNREKAVALSNRTGMFILSV